MSRKRSDSYTAIAKRGGISRAEAHRRTQAWIARGKPEAEARRLAAKASPGTMLGYMRACPPVGPVTLASRRSGIGKQALYYRMRVKGMSLEEAVAAGRWT